MDRVLLIDGANAFWRANFSFGGKPLHCPKDDDLNLCQCGQTWDIDCDCCPHDFVVVFNFFRNLRPQIEDGSPDKCFVCLEGRPQFRYNLFADYKANRIIKQAAKKETQIKFKRDAGLIVDLLQFLPITIAQAANYEADDLIGTLCENMKEENLTVISNDSDYIQLLQRGYQNLAIYSPIKKETMVAPDYPYVAWKCLNGDKSDNIPALLKPKKALQTIQNTELFKAFLAVEENRANFSVNRQLIEFHPIPPEEISIKEGVRNYVALKEEFGKMGFDSLIADKTWDKFTSTFDCLRY